MSVANQSLIEKPVVQSATALVAHWLDHLNVALHGARQASVAPPFAQDGHWRDLLAVTCSIASCQGASAIAALMVAK